MTHRLYVLKACEVFCKSCKKGSCTIKCERFLKFQAQFTKEMYNAIVIKNNSMTASKASVERYHTDTEFREKKINTSKKWFAKYPGYRKWYLENYKKGVSVTIKDWLKLHPEQEKVNS